MEFLEQTRRLGYQPYQPKIKVFLKQDKLLSKRLIITTLVWFALNLLLSITVPVYSLAPTIPVSNSPVQQTATSMANSSGSTSNPLLTTARSTPEIMQNFGKLPLSLRPIWADRRPG